VQDSKYLTDDEKEAILSKNAMRLYGLH